MAKEDTAVGGLFSKVAKFVRNPSTNWTDLDQKESDKESSYTKQALKEMIERKRRNDFVRKREFDMLRKLRRREAMGAPGSAEGSARPSFFQSSMPSKPDDRAMTLKKIDEIEAQMSMQWWKTKHAGAGGASTNSGAISSFPNSDMPNQSPDYPNGAGGKAGQNNLAYARTVADELTNALAASAAKLSAQRAASAAAAAPLAAPSPIAAPVQMPQMPATRAAAPVAPEAVPPAAPVVAPAAAPAANAAQGAPKTPIMGNMAAYDGGASTGFTASKLFAVDVDEVQHDPELEEAAIRFANGDDAGAEAGLLEALGQFGTRHQHEETWFAAFDLYRATAQNDRFESLAIDFAGKFGRSAPIWFSIPELVGNIVNPDAVESLGVVQKSDWRSPANFGVQTLAALNAALLKATPPWVLDWSVLKIIEPNAVVPLTKLFASWAVQPVQLRFLGAENLETVLRNATPSNDRSVSQDLWTLRMGHLRITHRPDEFELAALDFCVTYEVSPPSWESARCEYKALDANGQTGVGQTIIGEAVHDSIQSGYSGYDDGNSGNGQLSGQVAQLTVVELSGQIQGDPVGMLEKLEGRLAGADVMVISCAKLIRVDFSAAGTLLNWVSARQSEGRFVQFTDVHRLVAAFFHVIGISEHAKVVTRID
jgi:anti-anti-sigma regulatory factor